MEINRDFEAALSRKPMEIFYQDDELRIVLERRGNTALIALPDNTMTPYVVPLEHLPGATSWWQGHYFSDLRTALDYFEGVTS